MLCVLLGFRVPLTLTPLPCYDWVPRSPLTTHTLTARQAVVCPRLLGCLFTLNHCACLFNSPYCPVKPTSTVSKTALVLHSSFEF
jgi:hypothetical protein